MDGLRSGFFEPLVRSRRIVVAAAVRDEVARAAGALGAAPAKLFERVLPADSALIVRATAGEIAAVVRCEGAAGLSRGEIESVALVVARGFGYCGDEPLVLEVLGRLGTKRRWVPLAKLLAGLGPGIEIPAGVSARNPGRARG